MKKFILLFCCSFFIICNASAQWQVEYRTEVLKQGPDTLRLSLQVRWLGGTGQDFTLNQGTIRIRWNAASFSSISSFASINTCMNMTGATVSKGYTSTIRQKGSDGLDSFYLVAPLALNSAVNSSAWNTPGELIASGDPDSGFVVNNQFREIAVLNWRVFNSVGLANITIDDAASGFLTAGRFNNMRNCPSVGASNFLTSDVLNQDLGNLTPLPVELISFTSSIKRNEVTLNWKTTNEINNSGFDIERLFISNEKPEWIKVSFINGYGNTNEIKDYSFIDKSLQSGNYKYRLKQIDYNGNFTYFELENEVPIGIPSVYNLSQNYPNPFNPSTTINYDIPKAGMTKIELYDITGRLIETLINEFKEPGYYFINYQHNYLSSGIYFYRLITSEYTNVKKMVILK